MVVLRLITVTGNGSVPEWLMGADCKSASYAYVGSNPTRPTTHVLSFSSVFVIRKVELLVSKYTSFIRWL